MAIDLITGHQGVSHISADQIATINNAMMDNFGANKVMRLVGGELTADGLTITISEGYWRVNGFDMEIQEGETLYIDPTTIGLSRIDDIYVEILQDIPTGAQRAEIYIALGEPSATPTAPDEPTAPYLNTDILLQIIKLARVTVAEGAMIMEDYSVAYNIVTPEDLAEVQTAVDTAETHATTALNMIRSTSSDVYSSSKAYSVGDHVIYNNKVYKCITACSAASWSTNQNCFSKTTLTTAVTELNSDLNTTKSNLADLASDWVDIGSKFGSQGDITVSNIYKDFHVVVYVNNQKQCGIVFPVNSSMISNNPGDSTPLYLRAQGSPTQYALIHFNKSGNNIYFRLQNVTDNNNNVTNGSSFFVYGRR